MTNFCDETQYTMYVEENQVVSFVMINNRLDWEGKDKGRA